MRSSYQKCQDQVYKMKMKDMETTHRSFLWLWRSHAYLAIFRIISRWPHIETSLNRSVRFWCMDLNYHFHCHHRFTHLGVCTYVRLLGPCFKTGCVKSIVAIFMSRLATLKNQPNAQNVYKLQTANWHARQETSRTHSRSLSTQLFVLFFHSVVSKSIPAWRI